MNRKSVYLGKKLNFPVIQRERAVRQKKNEKRKNIYEFRGHARFVKESLVLASNHANYKIGASNRAAQIRQLNTEKPSGTARISEIIPSNKSEPPLT